MSRATPPTVTRVAILAVVAILVAQGLGVWGLLAVRKQTVEAARRTVENQVNLLARRLEAELASLRGDVAALAQSPPLAGLRSVSEDPMIRRWNRLDAESALLLFLQSHPEIGKIGLVDADAGVLLGAMQKRGTPVLFEASRPPVAEPGWRLVRWTLGESSALVVEAWLDPDRLLEGAAPGLADRVDLVVDGADEEPAPGTIRARAPVRGLEGSPGPGWTLVWTEPIDAPIAVLATPAERTNQIVFVQALLVLLTLGLGVLALRQAGRAASLEAEQRRQEEVRHLERQLVHSERLASVGRMAAGLAHEINNPLGGAANYLELVREDLEAGDVDAARAGIERVVHGIERASGVLREVLSFSAPEGGEGPRGRMDLRSIVLKSADFVRNQSRFEGAEVDVRLGDAPLEVEGNPVTLGQVFLNLLLNGIEAQARDLPNARMEITAERGTQEIAMRFADRGPGIAREVRKDLFEPFVSTKGSTGLGLAVCRRIVEDHGGRLEVEASGSTGTVFRLTLPSVPVEEGVAG